MNRLLPAFLLLPFIGLHAQQIQQEQFIGWRGNSIELHTFTDKDKHHSCSILMNGDSIRGFYMDADMQWSQQFNMVRKRDEQLYGGFIVNNKVYLILDNGPDPGLHNCVFDVTTGKLLEYFIPFETKKEKLIDRFSCGDHFVYFTFSKKTSEFIVHDFHDESNYSTMKYKFSDDTWEDITSNNVVSRIINIVKVDGEGECDVSIARNPKKIYLVNDTLQLLLNNKWGQTNIFSFDLRNQKVSNRVINHEDGKVNFSSLHYVQNSFLLNDKLYYTQANPDSLDVQIIDFASGKILQHYSATRDKDIAFKNTPIVQEGGSSIWTAGQTRELDKTRQLLRKMVGGGAVIEATENKKGQVELMIGSYKELHQAGGGMWMPGATASAPSQFLPVGGFSYGSWSKSARFKMLVDASSGAHIDGDMDRSINDRIEEYTKEAKIPPEAENLISCNGQYYYLYYNRNDHKLITRQF